MTLKVHSLAREEQQLVRADSQRPDCHGYGNLVQVGLALYQRHVLDYAAALCLENH